MTDKLQKVKEALEFYSSRSTYFGITGIADKDSKGNPLLNDWGTLAEKALAELTEFMEGDEGEVSDV